MFRHKSLVYLLAVVTLLLLTTFGAFAVSAQSESTTSDPLSSTVDQSEIAFESEPMIEAMNNMLDQMEAMMAAVPTDTVGRKLAPSMTQMLSGMMGLNQHMMAQMQTLPEERRGLMTPKMMSITGRVDDMMGQMQPMMGSMMAISGTVPMSGAIPMDMMGQAMMAHMMAMMNRMHSPDNGMMGPKMMDGTMAISGTMSMSSTMPMMGAGMMGAGMMDDAMMDDAMMAQMITMMSQMHDATGGGMMSGAMMDGSIPITGTMPMSGTMPMDMMGGGMMGDPKMMAMMAQMMTMMSQMHDATGGGMMGGAMMDGATSITETTATSDATGAAFEVQIAEDGGVTVEVAPLNLEDATTDSLDFQLALNTHSVELDQDLAELAVLLVDDVEYAASQWNGSGSGHHIAGQLSFAALDEGGEPILTGADSLIMVIRDLAGVDERTFIWRMGE